MRTKEIEINCSLMLIARQELLTSNLVDGMSEFDSKSRADGFSGGRHYGSFREGSEAGYSTTPK